MKKKLAHYVEFYDLNGNIGIKKIVNRDPFKFAEKNSFIINGGGFRFFDCFFNESLVVDRINVSEWIYSPECVNFGVDNKEELYPEFIQIGKDNREKIMHVLCYRKLEEDGTITVVKNLAEDEYSTLILENTISETLKCMTKYSFVSNPEAEYIRKRKF